MPNSKGIPPWLIWNLTMEGENKESLPMNEGNLINDKKIIAYKSFLGVGRKKNDRMIDVRGCLMNREGLLKER